MKRNFTLLISLFFVVSTFQMQAQNTVYPGADISRLYKAPKATVAPVIDGNHTDAGWQLAPWKSAFAVTPINSDWTTVAVGTPVAPEGEFSGANDVGFKYKFIWDDKYYYMLMRWTDDKIIYSDAHNGYRTGSLPTYAAAITNSVPATGAGDGTSYQTWRMDQIALWLTPYTDALATGASYNRANNGLFHTFYPGKITNAVKPEAILWSPKHNPVSTTSGAPQTHQATVAGKFDAAENAYYIEFRDTTWAALFSTVRTKLTGQKDYATVAPAIGDKFLFTGEINDADGTTNRRDYALLISHLSIAPPATHLNNLSEAVTIELVDKVSSVPAASINSKFNIYPNPNSTSILNLNRAADVEIFNVAGQMVLKSLNSSRINIAGLKQGVYIVKDNDGNIQKMIRK